MGNLQKTYQTQNTTLKKTSGLAIASLVLGIIGILTSCFVIGVIPAIIGLILAIVDLANKKTKNGMNIAGLVLSIVSTIIFLIFALFVSDGASTTDSQETLKQEKNEAEATAQPTQIEDEYLKITSTELIDSYNSNQVKCKNTYDGVKLEITGTVSSVGTDILNDVYVCLGHDTEYTFVGIQCYAKDKETESKIAELLEGDVITVRGIGDCGSLTFSVNKAVIVE